MARLGTFDTTAVPGGWFGPEVQAVGWFHRHFLHTSGAVLLIYEASGGIVFGGAASANQRAVREADGGIVFGGAAEPAQRGVRVAAGGLTFGGAADVSFVPSGGSDPPRRAFGRLAVFRTDPLRFS